MSARQHPSTPAPSTPAALSSPRSNKEMGDVLAQLLHKQKGMLEEERRNSAASTPTGASPRETSAEGGPGRSGSTRKKKRERDGLKETATAGDQRRRQNLEPEGSKASLPIQPDLTGASPCPARQPPPAYHPPQRSTERQPSGHGPTQDDEESEWTIGMRSIKDNYARLQDGYAWASWAVSGLVSCLAYGAMVVQVAWRYWKNWNRRRRSKNARTEVTPPAVMDGNIMEDDEKAAESSPSEASRPPSRKPHRRKPHRRKPHSSDALQQQELAQDPPAERPKVPPPPPPAPGIRRRLARHAGKALAVLLITALVLLPWYWPPRTFRSTSQPVDDLIHATHLTSAALDLLVTTATPMFNSHWYVCRIMEASEEVFVDPDVHPEFGKAWAPEKGNLGWGCPKPEVDFVDFPPPTPNEHFGRLGVLLAGELWNMTLLLRRSCAESYAMAQGATHLATQIEDEVRLSDLCRQLTPWTSLLRLRAVFSTYRSEAPLLNAKIAQLNSTISTFTASHSSLITDLEVSATICLQRLRAWRAAALEGGIWPTPDRDPNLFANIRALCEEFRRGRDDGQKSAPVEKMVTLWSEKEVNLPPFLVARNRFEEARGVLGGIPSADRLWNNRVVQWISQPPAIGWWDWWDWMTGRRNGTIASWTHSRLRCWTLGTRTKAPVGEGAGTQEKLLETCQRMKLAATQAGTVKLLSPEAESSDVASEDVAFCQSDEGEETWKGVPFSSDQEEVSTANADL